MLNALDSFFEKLPRFILWTITIVFLCGISVIDYYSGPELSFSIFYLFPISMGAWYSGGMMGVALSVMGAFVWLWADIGAGHAARNVRFGS